MEGLSRRQFLKLGTVIITTALLDRFAGVQDDGAWLQPTSALSRTVAPSLASREQGTIKRGSLTFSGADFRDGELVGLSVSAGKLGLLRRSEGMFTSPVIEAPIPFGAVAPHWVANVPLGADIWVQIRCSPDGRAWSPWRNVWLETPYGSTPLARYFGQLVVDYEPGKLNRYVQYRIGMVTSVPDPRLEPSLSSLTLTFTDASDGPTTTEALSRQGLVAGTALQSAAAHLGVISRTAWGCPDGQASPRWSPEYQTVTHLVIHHTGSSNAITDWAAHVRFIWDYHANTLGWGDIGYNYLIDPSGNIYEGRAGGDDVIAGHVYGFNSGTMGVGCLGTYATVGISSKTQTSLESLLAWKCNQRGINPTGSRSITGYSDCAPLVIDQPTISGHRDFPGHHVDRLYPQCLPNYNGTTCPGDQLAALLPAIRSNVARLDSTPPVATMASLPRYTAATSFTVSWSGTDATGIKSFDVQRKVGAAGTWTNWLTGTTARSQSFTGQDGSTYYFRCRATDNAGNVGAWSSEVFTTVDTSPPTCQMVSPTGSQTRTWFVVKWQGSDSISGVKWYDLEYNDSGAGWRSWISGTTATQSLFEGKAGRTYSFRCRAHDNAGNVSNWSSSISVTAGSSSTGLYKARLPVVMKNYSP